MTEIAAPLPPPIEPLRRFALQHLSRQLTLLFDSADDWLFDQINHQVAGEQQGYLDLMRFLRLQRADISKAFLSNITDAFSAIGKIRTPEAKPKLDEASVQGLSLVDNNKMEETVALDSMVQRARNEVGLQLDMLCARLTHLYNKRLVDRNNNPLDPRQICAALSDAVAEIDWDIKQQLVFYKLFQIHIFSQYQSLVAHCNELLCGAGVLSHLSEQEVLQQYASRQRKDNQFAAGVQGKASNPIAHLDGANPGMAFPGAESDSRLTEPQVAYWDQQRANLLAQAFPAIGQPQAFGATQSVIGSVSHQASALPLSDVLALMKQLQQRLLSTGQDAQDQYLQPQALNQALTNLILQRPKDEGPARIADLDSNIINLVALLFESVLDLQHLPPSVKSLLSRLQLPYIRVAIADPQFLLSPDHPARQLMNSLAKAGARLNETEVLTADPTYQCMVDLVSRILKQELADAEFYQLCCKEFEEFVAHEERRAHLISQRVTAREEGRSKANAARQEVLQAVQALIDKKPMPREMADIIRRPWVNYLSYVYLREGKASSTWQRALALIPDMLSCLKPLAEGESTIQRQQLIANVETRIQAGCETIGFIDAELSQWLLKLQRIYQGAIAEPQQTDLDINSDEPIDQQAKVPAEIRPQPEGAANLESEVDASAAAVGADTKELDGDHAEASHADAQKSQVNFLKSKLADLRAPRLPKRSPADGNDTVITLDVMPKAAPETTVLLPALPDEDQHLQQAKNLSVGCWLEFCDQGHVIRCKLAAHIASVDKLIFVNRSGAKLFEKNLLQMAHHFKSGDFKLLDDNQLFDRALEDVISGLKKIRQ